MCLKAIFISAFLVLLTMQRVWAQVYEPENLLEFQNPESSVVFKSEAEKYDYLIALNLEKVDDLNKAIRVLSEELSATENRRLKGKGRVHLIGRVLVPIGKRSRKRRYMEREQELIRAIEPLVKMRDRLSLERVTLQEKRAAVAQ